MIDERTIEQILNRVNIVDVVSNYADLKRNGSNYKCCCPFHNERTPSFIVNPARNSWHCFGACNEGGDAISFIMKAECKTFPEAVKQLAASLNIQIEETDDRAQTAEQKKASLRREAMFIAYDAAQQFFVEQLRASGKESRLAMDYAAKRWSKEFLDEYGIGYAPLDGKLFLEYVRLKAVPQPPLLDTGLVRTSEKDQSLYSFFRGRIMIPIRDLMGRIIGYTARTMSQESDVPKYINSRTSLIYSKENSIFGIHIAARAAARESKYYLVEGAPDVLRMHIIGANNTVASLGSAWTEKQFLQLKRITTNICFLPDADPAKDGEPYGTGIKAVMKNGLLALSLGFNITVKEIPLTDEGKKNDPDTFCTSRAILEGIEEQDFIMWYANKLFAASPTQDEKTKAVAKIADLIALIEDELRRQMYIDQLSKLHQGKMLWRNAIKAAIKRLEEARLNEDADEEAVDIAERYGFHVQHNCYVSVGDDGKKNLWSNFIMKPLFHIKDKVMAKRIYLLINEDGVEEMIELKQEELVSLIKFRQHVEGKGNFIWNGSDKLLQRLKKFLYATTDTAIEIIQLGWQRQGFFAFGNGIFHEGKWYPVDELGIVRLEELGNFYLPAFSPIYQDDTQFFQFERQFIHTNLSNISLIDYTSKLVDVFGNNAKIGICFLLASLFRDVVVGKTKNFPMLNLFGPKGSGKSQLGHSLMAFFIRENVPPNISNSTLPALANAVGQCANALVHLDEFRNTIDEYKREFLKGIWDGTGRNRMNMDRDKKREVTPVCCGVIVSGQEMATADIALFSRFIFLSYAESQFSHEAKRKFADLLETRKKGCSHLTLEILKHRHYFETEFNDRHRESYQQLSDKLEEFNVEDRIIENWAIPLAALNTLKTKLDLPFSYNEVLELCVAGCINQNDKNAKNNEVATFWSVVEFLKSDGKIWLGGDYRIETTDKIKCSNHKYEIEFPYPKRILYMRQNRIFQLYRMHAKHIDEKLLAVNTLLYYLENSSAYLGRKQSMRFKNMVNGNEQKREVKCGKDQTKFVSVSVVDQAMVFDYDMLSAEFALSIDEEIDNTP